MATVRLNVVEPCLEPGPPRIAKRRSGIGRLLIRPVNLGLRWLRADVRVLRDREWIARERAVHRLAYGESCEIGARGRLLMPRRPGITLDEHGRDLGIDPQERLRAVSAAALALLALHRLVSPLGGEPFSHGDAKLGNVMFDPSTAAARWFDFDTAHVTGAPAVVRRADDLRAFIFSALEVLRDVPAQAVVETIHAAYDDPEPWSHLAAAVARGPIHRSLHHRAQARPPRARCDEAERILGGLGRVEVIPVAGSSETAVPAPRRSSGA